MIDSIPARLLRRADERPDAPAYDVHDGAGWRSVSWRAYADEVRAVAKGLVALGFAPGDAVCILGTNRPEWVVFDVAAMMAGGVPAGIYVTSSPSEVRYVVDHAEARVVLVEDEAQWSKIEAERHRIPRLEHVVTMRGTTIADPMAMTWDQLIERGRGVPDAELDDRLQSLHPSDRATFIYTSGTTGPPKAVVLSHENLTHTSDAACEMIVVRTDERLVSYLPLSHIAEQVFTIHGHLTAGYRIWYARSMETLLEEFQTVRPTLVFGVPRVWEKMHARLSDALSKATGIKAFLAGWAQQVGRQAAELRTRGQEPTGWLGLQDRLAHQRVQGPILARLGLDACRVAISGAAPISRDVLTFFSGIGLVIHEVYGQSEGTGPTTFNRPGHTRLGTVGTPIPGAEVVIADDGEILLRGKNVFQGYYKDPEATAATLEGGWLHSGDLGRFDDEGFLHVTGRKKDILITAGGKNIAPNNLEQLIKQSPLVSQAVVIGDRRPYLVALITLDAEAARAFAAEHGLPTDGLHERPELRAALQRHLEAEVNPELARVEQIKHFAVLPRELSIDAGELTPTMKIKRHVVERAWADVVEGMYLA